MNKNVTNNFGVELTPEEMVNVNGGVIPIVAALAWGFGIGFPAGVVIGIAKN